ncbi:argonaute/piwi family protein [Candidatus Kuenenia stuttgartensis]|uniref:argonaute/piwi family protein n=1 Tax=Kuenenia stuttgartiensis TaxID=174633 RepID=UPI00146E77A5|nr:Piwi domain-containing protein [Candidatus Kuenenia stuttgartiensis]
MPAQFPDNDYYNYAAVIIGPFSKYESDEEEEKTYYEIKKLLLDKGITSQFIANKTVRSGNFNYCLPNIAIAILAKLGGIPWKLNTKKYNDLVIGYNYKKLQDQKWIGSAVFFDNEGRLGRIYGFSEERAGEDLISHLKIAIDDYSKSIGSPDRLTIHYYKPPRKDEIKNFEQVIYNKLNLDIPFALTEVNDTKSKSDICFDTEYDMGMPESGTYVKIGKDEYLLFNNNRYEKEPVRKVKDELPIKVKIFHADVGGFSHREILSQVYEFSRLNWKGLMQTSQPVTTKYSKMIADFSLHFNGEISENKISQKTPWFI